MKRSAQGLILTRRPRRHPQVLALLLIAVAGLPVAHPAAQRRDHQPPQVVFEAPEELDAYKSRLKRLHPAALLRMMDLVGLDTPGESITVVLVPESHDLARATPRFIAGFARIEAGTVVLFPARSVGYPHDSLEDVLLHEIAHVLIARAAGRAPVPRWFHEGVALAAERTAGLEDQTHLMLALMLERRSVGELDAEFAGSARNAERAYALSGALVRSLLQQHGGDVVARILTRLAAGETFEQAFLGVTGESVAGAERAFWRASRWYYLISLLTSSMAIWLTVVMVAVYARRARARRRAILHRLWQEEEDGEGPP
jgi:Peptidase MA superfamily